MTGSLLTALLPIFLIIGLGILAGRSGRLDNGKVGQLNTLVMDFAVPAAMFAAICRASRHELLQQWGLLLVLAASLVGLWLLVYLLQRMLFRQSSGAAAVLAISVALPNFAAAGAPLLAVVAGSHGRIQTALAIAVGATILSPMTLLLLDLDRVRREGAAAGRGEVVRAACLRVAKSPLVLSPLLGVAVVLADLRLPAALLRSFALLGDAASGVALLLTGLVLSANRLSLTTKVGAAVLVANLLHPALSAWLAGLLPMQPIDRVGTVLLSALPSGFFGILFALRYGIEIREAASVVALSTVFAVVTLAATMVLLGAAQAGVTP